MGDCAEGPAESLWSEWRYVGTCTTTCGLGTRDQTRTCMGGVAGGPGCEGVERRSIVCNLGDCAEGSEGSLGEWRYVGTCTTTFGLGTREQTWNCMGGVVHSYSIHHTLI